MSKQYINRMSATLDSADQIVQEAWGQREGGKCTRAAAMIKALHQTIETQAAQEGVQDLSSVPTVDDITTLLYPRIRDIVPIGAVSMPDIDITQIPSVTHIYAPLHEQLTALRSQAPSNTMIANNFSPYLENANMVLLIDCVEIKEGEEPTLSQDALGALFSSIEINGFAYWANYFQTTINSIQADNNLSDPQKKSFINLLEQADNLFFAFASVYYQQVASNPDIQAYLDYQENTLVDASNLNRTTIDRALLVAYNQSASTEFARSLKSKRIEWLTNARDELIHTHNTDLLLRLNAFAEDAQAKLEGRPPPTRDALPQPVVSIWEEYGRVMAALQSANTPDEIRAFQKAISTRIQDLTTELKSLPPLPKEDQRKTHPANLHAHRASAYHITTMAKAISTMAPVKELIQAFAEKDKTKIGQYTREIWLSRGASLMFAALGTTVAALSTEMMIAGGIASATHAEFGATLGHTLADPSALAHGVQNLAANDPAILASIIIASIIGVVIIGALCKLADDKLANRYSEESTKNMKVIETKVAEAKNAAFLRASV